MDEISMLILSRSIERVCMVGVGLASIWMGYKLFTSAYISDQRAEFKWNELVVQLHKVGPGAFFVIFGVAILVSSYVTGFSVKDIKAFGSNGNVESETHELKYAEKGLPALDDSIVAINWAIELAQAKEDANISDQRENIQKGLAYYQYTRGLLLSSRFGKSAYDAWNLYKSTLATSPQSIPANLLNSVKDVDAAARNLRY
ncbi:hypothetical protein ACC848_05650 [Rhizobium johnstonii]|uniref:hypothetical protein n=1 Tax=Rhizobium johnstonii TaxID=3019933 RepID=UPI003F99AC8C